MWDSDGSAAELQTLQHASIMVKRLDSSSCFLFSAAQVLNAKPENVERESEIVAQSGRKGGVTISTNMAGRGTDILLGGNPDYMARLKLRELLMPEVVSQVHNVGCIGRPAVSQAARLLLRRDA